MSHFEWTAAVPEASRSAIVPAGRWNAPAAAGFLKLLRLVPGTHPRSWKRQIKTLPDGACA
jgi:hypothetical protein